MKIITEIVSFESKAEIAQNDFTGIINRLEQNFHSQQTGFIDTELLHAEGSNIWIMIQHWDSLQNMKKSSSNMFKDAKTGEFRNSIDPKSVQIKVYTQTGIWKQKSINAG